MNRVFLELLLRIGWLQREIASSRNAVGRAEREQAARDGARVANLRPGCSDAERLFVERCLRAMAAKGLVILAGDRVKLLEAGRVAAAELEAALT